MDTERDKSEEDSDEKRHTQITFVPEKELKEQKQEFNKNQKFDELLDS